MDFKGRSQIVPRVNLASLIDVVFLLLIFFLLTSSFAGKTGISIQLPRISTGEQTFIDSPLNIFVKQDSLIYLNGKVTPRELLKVELEILIRKNPEQRIYFYADKALSYETVCQILDEIKRAGGKGVVLRTDQ